LRVSYDNPQAEQLIGQDDLYLKDFQTKTFGVAAQSTTIKTFEGEKDQKLSLSLYMSESNVNPQGSSGVRTLINITDSKGEKLIYDTNIGPSYTVQPLQVRNSGTVSIAITNQEGRPISVTMNLRQSGAPQSFDYVDDVIVNFSNWLMIISAPIFALGIWLVVSERRKKGSSSTPEEVPPSPT